LRHELQRVRQLVSERLSPDGVQLQHQLRHELLFEQFGFVRRELDAIHPMRHELSARLLGGLDRLQHQLRYELLLEQLRDLQESLISPRTSHRA
jgi:hypothetical protein